MISDEQTDEGNDHHIISQARRRIPRSAPA
jgi:hypothetical protein